MNAAEKVWVTNNPQQALEWVKERCTSSDSEQQPLEDCFNLILLDIQMPEMNGFEFMEILQGLHANNEIFLPNVVILTSSAHSKDKAKAAQFPVKGYLVKPLDEDKIHYLLSLTHPPDGAV